MLLFSKLPLNGLLPSIALCLLSLQIQQRLMIALIASIYFKLYLMMLGFHRVHFRHWCIYTRMFSSRLLLIGSYHHLFLSIWECIRAIQSLPQCLVCSLIGLRSLSLLSLQNGLIRSNRQLNQLACFSPFSYMQIILCCQLSLMLWPNGYWPVCHCSLNGLV